VTCSDLVVGKGLWWHVAGFLLGEFCGDVFDIPRHSMYGLFNVYLPIHLGSLFSGYHVGIHTTYIEFFNFYTERCLFLLVGCLHQGLGPPPRFHRVLTSTPGAEASTKKNLGRTVGSSHGMPGTVRRPFIIDPVWGRHAMNCVHEIPVKYTSLVVKIWKAYRPGMEMYKIDVRVADKISRWTEQ